MISAGRPMIVVIHDFAPVFSQELNSIVETLLPIVGRQISAAVVPRWHGSTSGRMDRSYLDLLGTVQERLLHGWTHQSQSRFHPISLLTGRADEFRGMDSSTILTHIQSARNEFAELTGEQPEGFLPPAWQLPIRSTELRSFRFVVRFRSIECCQDHVRARSLATWSWDWGRVGSLGYGGEIAGALLHWINGSSIPCITIHPADVRRGYLPRQCRLIRQFLEIGYKPTTATEVMSQVKSDMIGTD